MAYREGFIASFSSLRASICILPSLIIDILMLMPYDRQPRHYISSFSSPVCPPPVDDKQKNVKMLIDILR